jgi:tetratricopeptide (TPR) repeat protein
VRRAIPVRLVWLLAAVACVGAAAKHEQLGDRAYAERNYRDALVEYRLALVQRPRDSGLRAKAALAGLRAGEVEAAAEEYAALAGLDEARAAEAADGLERVAQMAADRGDERALAMALDQLQRIAPGRALGGFAGELAGKLGDAAVSEEALTVLFYAAAAAPDARVQDSLMYAYARRLLRLGRCQEAIPAFESLMRRQLDGSVVRRSRNDLGYCALTLGRQAHARNLPLSAEEWYLIAVQRAGETAYGRAAYLGLGDVLFARREYVGAAAAYESALLGGLPGDSIARVALERLAMVDRAGTGIP